MKSYGIHWTIFVLVLIIVCLVVTPTLNSRLLTMQVTEQEETADNNMSDSVSAPTKTTNVTDKTSASSGNEDSQSDSSDAATSGDRKDMSDYKNIGTIYIGDSRTVGLDKAVDVEDKKNGTFVVAKVGQGYSWFVSTAIPEVKSIQRNNTKYDGWRYIINLGVNDLGSIKQYLNKYEDLAEQDNVEIILVSVNPVQNYPTITNDQIKKFNAKYESSGFYYIDTYNVLMKKGYKTQDGLHYVNDTYQLIYDTIQDKLNED